MFLPLAQLAVPLAVPRGFAGGASLGGRLAALLALGIVHKVFENVGAVQLYHTLHILLCLFRIWAKKVLDLVFGDFIPISTIYDFCPQFG